MPEATRLEHSILSDILTRTGLRFRLIGGINTRDPETARVVLPILAEWAAKVQDPNHRNAIYACFHTPHARPYFDNLISWWQNEKFELARATLTQVILSLATPADGERLFDLLCRLSPMPFQYKLASKLAKFPSVARQVKDKVVKALEESDLHLTDPVSDLQEISQIEDPRIRQWFERNLESPDPAVRTVAKKLLRRRTRLPSGLERTDSRPDRTAELFSTEVDAAELRSLLRGLADQFALKIPANVSNGAFLSSLSGDSWALARIATHKGDLASIWFRLEDIDTVQVVVTMGHPGKVTAQTNQS